MVGLMTIFPISSINPTRPFRSNAKSLVSDPGFLDQSFRTNETEHGSAVSASSRRVPPTRQILRPKPPKTYPPPIALVFDISLPYLGLSPCLRRCHHRHCRGDSPK